MNAHQTKLFASKKSDDWATPRVFYDLLDAEFHFDFDPCPLHSAFDGLSRDWGRRNFVNPPYSKVPAFLQKAREQLESGAADLCVFLVFVNTDTRWFHKYIYHRAQIRFIKGRLMFGTEEQNSGHAAMRPSMVCILKARNRKPSRVRQDGGVLVPRTREPERSGARRRADPSPRG